MLVLDENIKTINLESFQNGFFCSVKRFPGFISAWGTGKTMTAILKGVLLSSVYSNNLGLIVRKKFTDLRDSTLKDFERYTGLHVPMSTKEITLPGTNSTIMFRHGDELSGLQNVNLGWVYVEQAEEFETAEQFDMLRGRLRRELEPVNSYEANIPEYRDLVQYLKENPLRQLMIGANACGHNWCWHRWIRAPKEEYDAFEAVSWDNQDNLPSDFINDLRALRHDNIKKFNRYVLNSHEDYDMEGAYYAALMSDALKEGRVERDNLYDATQGVYTFWDLGTRASDTTAIWCVQFIRNEIWLIDYYENYGQGMDHYNEWLNKQKYNFLEHWLPPDAKQALQGRTISRRYDILKEYRTQKHEQVKLVNPHLVQSRIQETRDILHLCRFNTKCALGVDALNHYKTEKQENLSTESRFKFQPKPLHNWASNGSDAFGYMCWVYREQLIINDERIGHSKPYQDLEDDDCDPYKNNPLDFGRRTG